MPCDSPKVAAPGFWARAYLLSPHHHGALCCHTTVPCPEENKCEPTQTRSPVRDAGLPPQLLTEILFLKFDKTITIFEFSTQEY